MPGRTRPWQKSRELLNRLEGDLPDEELAMLRQYVEKRSGKDCMEKRVREAAQRKVAAG